MAGTKREVARSESEGYLSVRLASGLPFPKGWPLSCPSRAFWVHLLLGRVIHSVFPYPKL